MSDQPFLMSPLYMLKMKKIVWVYGRFFLKKVSSNKNNFFISNLKWDFNVLLTQLDTSEFELASILVSRLGSWGSSPCSPCTSSCMSSLDFSKLHLNKFLFHEGLETHFWYHWSQSFALSCRDAEGPLCWNSDKSCVKQKTWPPPRDVSTLPPSFTHL